MSTLQHILEKYGDTIAEEVNVKQVVAMDEGVVIQKIIKPLGNKLGAKFGKDTSLIIQLAKDGNVDELDGGRITVNGPDQSRELEPGEYEISYQGLDEQTMAVEQNAVIKLDLTIDEQLEKEGNAREVVRFLNNMRKTADYRVDARVALSYFAEDEYSKKLLKEFGDLFKEEALLKDFSETKTPQGDVVETFEYEYGNIIFAVKS